MILAISGTPGTGKTAVAKQLSKKLGWETIELNKLAKEKDLFSGYDEKRKCDIVDVDRVDEEIKKIKNDVIIESHFAHDIRSDAIVILRTNPAELRKRLEKKDWKKEKIEENILAEIMEVCLSEAMETDRKVVQINTTKYTPEKAANEIIKKLKL